MCVIDRKTQYEVHVYKQTKDGKCGELIACEELPSFTDFDHRKYDEDMPIICKQYIITYEEVNTMHIDK